MQKKTQIPFIETPIPAGFPSPAQDWMENRIDLNEMLISSPSSTFLFRVSGDSMVNAGILDGSLLLVDRGEQVAAGAIVVASVDGEFTVKRYRLVRDMPFLFPENASYKPMKFTETTEIWGVVTATITQCLHL